MTARTHGSAATDSITARALAEQLGGQLVGEGDTIVTGVRGLEEATAQDVTFVADTRLSAQVARTAAGVVLIAEAIAIPELGDDGPEAIIRVPDAELAVAEVLALFAPAPWQPSVGVHDRASVDPTAQIDPSAALGPFVVVGPECRIGPEVVLNAGVVLGAEVVIGAGSRIGAGSVLSDRVRLGARVILHQNVSIGADGLGYRPAPHGAGLVKMPHIGDVILEDEVEIGAGSCVDRGKFGSTRVGHGTKIDNLVQIGHNCVIGRWCVIAALAGLAGSVRLGDGVLIGGGAGIADHRVIGSGARVAAHSGVIGDVPAGQACLGYPAEPRGQALRQFAALRKLPGLLDKLRRGLPIAADRGQSGPEGGSPPTGS